MTSVAGRQIFILDLFRISLAMRIGRVKQVERLQENLPHLQTIAVEN